jgi:hypothetical protein
MNRSRVVSAEKTEDFLKFDSKNLIVDINKIVHTKQSSNGMFIPIKHSVLSGTTSFKLQTPEVSGFLVDCDPAEKPGKQYKINLLLDSTNTDPVFLPEDVELQKETVEILNQFKSACIAQLKENKPEFEKKTKKINTDTWNYMMSSFDVVRPYIKTDNGRTVTSYYINPKIFNNNNFKTSFVYKNHAITCEEAVKRFLNKRFYCIALFSIDSLFFQSNSNKLFAQAKLENLIITRFSNSASEKISIPARLLQIQQTDSSSEESDSEETSAVDIDDIDA